MQPSLPNPGRAAADDLRYVAPGASAAVWWWSVRFLGALLLSAVLVVPFGSLVLTADLVLLPAALVAAAVLHLQLLGRRRDAAIDASGTGVVDERTRRAMRFTTRRQRAEVVVHAWSIAALLLVLLPALALTQPTTVGGQLLWSVVGAPPRLLLVALLPLLVVVPVLRLADPAGIEGEALALRSRSDASALIRVAHLLPAVTLGLLGVAVAARFMAVSGVGYLD